MAFWYDLRYNARQLGKSPGFTVVSIATLAFGIGVTTATFSTADGMMWKPIPLHNIGQLAVILQRVHGDPGDFNWNALGDIADIQKRGHAFMRLAWWVDGRVNIIGAGGEPERVTQYLVSPDFFDVMEEQPALGRGFLEGEDEPGRNREVILSDTLWRRRFRADRGVVGQNVRLDDISFRVVGVMPPQFQFPKTAELWTPLPLKPGDRRVRGDNRVMVVGRLSAGYTSALADAEVGGISAQLEREYPATNQGRRYGVMSVQTFLVGYYNRQYMSMLLGAVLFVLLITCVNVANLQLARSLSRSREIALRMAVGASRGQLVLQLLTESVILAAVGGLFGVGVASWSLRAILGAMPAGVARYVTGWNEIHLDGRALALTCAASILSGILAGLAPAVQCSRPNLVETLREGGSGSSSSRARHRLRAVLVAGEIALAVMLLVGAGLMARSFGAMANASAPLEPESLLTMRLAITERSYPDKLTQGRYYGEVLKRITALPGVKMAAEASSIPYAQHRAGYRYEIDGQPDDPASRPVGDYEAVSPNYFATLRVPLRRGRLLQATDGRDEPEVAVINEFAARRWFQSIDPVGHQIRINGGKGEKWMTIVGVVGDTAQSVYDRGSRAMLLVPFEQHPQPWMDVAVRAAGDPLSLASAVIAAVRAVDPEEPVTNVVTMRTLFEHEATGILFVAGMLTVFGVLALGLAAIGVYGVTAHVVNEQTREIGIRIALGAPRGRVLRMVFRRGLAIALTGIALGISLSLGLAKLLAALLWGASASDPLAFVGIPVVLLAAAVFAMGIPALRAMRTDPMIALRYD